MTTRQFIEAIVSPTSETPCQVEDEAMVWEGAKPTWGVGDGGRVGSGDGGFVG